MICQCTNAQTCWLPDRSAILRIITPAPILVIAPNKDLNKPSKKNGLPKQPVDWSEGTKPLTDYQEKPRPALPTALPPLVPATAALTTTFWLKRALNPTAIADSPP